MLWINRSSTTQARLNSPMQNERPRISVAFPCLPSRVASGAVHIESGLLMPRPSCRGVPCLVAR
jgi:hypothetical protein